MQVTMDGYVRYAGHELIEYKDGRKYVNVSVVDGDNVPFTIFCPGSVAPVLQNLSFGDNISFTFDVRRWNNNLNLRVKEVFA